MGKSVDRKQVDEIKNDTISKDFWRNNECTDPQKLDLRI